METASGLGRKNALGMLPPERNPAVEGRCVKGHPVGARFVGPSSAPFATLRELQPSRQSEKLAPHEQPNYNPNQNQGDPAQANLTFPVLGSAFRATSPLRDLGSRLSIAHALF